MPFSVIVLTGRPSNFEPVERALAKNNMKSVPKFTVASLYDKDSMRPFLNAGNVDLLLVDIRHILFDGTGADAQRRARIPETQLENPVTVEDIAYFRTAAPDTPLVLLYDAEQRDHVLRMVDDGKVDDAVTAVPVLHGTYLRTTVASCLSLRQRRALVRRKAAAVRELAQPIFDDALERALGQFREGHRMQARDLIASLRREAAGLLPVSDDAIRTHMERHFDVDMNDVIDAALARATDAAAQPFMPLLEHADAALAGDEIEHTIIAIQGQATCKTTVPIATELRHAVQHIGNKPTMIQLRTAAEALQMAESMPISMMVIDRTASDLDEVLAARNASIPPAFAVLVTSSPLDKNPETRVLSGECDGFWVVVPGQHHNLFARELERCLRLAERTMMLRGRFEVERNLATDVTTPLEEIVTQAPARLSKAFLRLLLEERAGTDPDDLLDVLREWWKGERPQADLSRWANQVHGAVAIACQAVRDYIVSLIFCLPVVAREGEERLPEIENTTVLVVDDSKINLKAANAMLTQVGYKVKEANNGAEGLREAIRTLPTIILLDLHMPGMDGITVLKKLKSHPRTERIPVVMLTSEATVRAGQQCMQSGAADYVLKPLRKHYLLERLERQVLGHDKPEARAA